MHQIRFSLGELTALPDPPSWIWGPLRGRERGWAEEEEGKGRGKWREGPQVTVEPGPFRALLRHWAVCFSFPNLREVENLMDQVVHCGRK